MHPAGLGVDPFLQGVGVGALQLAQLAPVEHPRRQVVTPGGEPLEDVGAGGVGAALAALAAGQVHLVEQDLAQLLGRADGEGAPDQFVDLRLQLGDTAGEVVGQAP